MLPHELSILSRALKANRCYTFTGHPKLCHELEEVDAVLERIRQAESLSEVHAVINRLVTTETSGRQIEMRL